MNKRIFISFAIEDENLRDLLIGQRNNNNSPFEFMDMSAKEPWKNSWKTNCRRKIKSCDGLIAVITNNTRNADGQLWEIKCAEEEKIPIYYIRGNNDSMPTNIPPIIPVHKVKKWKWSGISEWIRTL